MTRFRTPVPDDGYLAVLGRAAYTWAYTEWTVLYLIHWQSGDDLANCAGGTGGAIVKALHRLLQAPPPAEVSEAAWTLASSGSEGLLRLSKRRNDILHARPATTPSKQQRLNRWAPGRDDALPGLIEPDDLSEFILGVEHARSQLNPLFEELRALRKPEARLLVGWRVTVRLPAPPCDLVEKKSSERPAPTWP